jgi:membrane-bound lytic murein transglycosylase D
MLKTPLSVCLCGSFFLLPVGFARDNRKNENNPSKTKAVDARSFAIKTTAPKAPMNEMEMQFAKRYIRKSGRNLINIKHRSKIPFSIIDSVFLKHRLPTELKYLAVIESELKPSATSRVGALGPWQLMPATAHIFGLKTSRNADERRDYYKSTTAAARYLRDLYAVFGDWLLVIAAYNGGPSPVHNAIDKSGSRNFWMLQSYLPKETRQHVKKFIATQYYFEGQGSLTTLTKAETEQFLEAVNANSKLNSIPAQETSEEKFKRVMLESEACLRRKQ